MRALLFLALVGCSAPAEAPAPSADTAIEARRRDDDGWSPCVGARPAGCGRCPDGQKAMFRGVPPNREFGCFDGAGNKTPSLPAARAFAVPR